MAYEFESTNEVQNMLLDFQTLPDVLDEDVKGIYLSIAKNQAVQRLVKDDIANAEADYNTLVSDGEIELAIKTYNKLNALRNILELAETQGSALVISDEAKVEGIKKIQQVLSVHLERFREQVQMAEPPKLLNHRLVSRETRALMKATNEEKLANTKLFEWQRRFTGFRNEIGQWLSERTAFDLIMYARRGQSLLNEYADLVDEGEQITVLVQAANKKYAKEAGIAELLKKGKNHNDRWRPQAFYGSGTCVNFGGNVYYASKGGTSGTKQPMDAGTDGTVSWTLLAPLDALNSYVV